MKKAIVTGANGFIGSWLIKELVKNNVEVIAVVRNKESCTENISKKVRIIYTALRDISDLYNKIPDRDIDVFYHLAWDGTGGVARANYEIQLLNSKYACDCAIIAKKLKCKKFICIGTITEKVVENIFNFDIKSENTIYGIAKHTAHCLLDVLCEKLELTFVWARLSNIYGANNSTGNIVSYTLGEFQKCKKPIFSKAEQSYDLMYVKDAVRALYLVGKVDCRLSCYFIGSGNPQILKEYLLTIRDIFGNEAEIGLGEKPEDGLKYSLEWFETKLLQEDTGFKASYTFEEGISETIEYNRKLN